MGSDDGGGDFQGQQAKLEAQKQAARDRLNALFGNAPSGAQAPTRDKFMSVVDGASDAGAYASDPLASAALRAQGLDPATWSQSAATGTGGFDQAGFDAAQKQFDDTKAAGAARDQLYQTVRDNTFTAGKRKLDEDKTKAQRNLKFELFAKGLNGGSADIDQNAMLGRTYDQGVMDLGGKADAAKAQFRGDDESTRLGLLQSIDSGTDEGSAISSAMNSMRVNSDRAAAAAQGTTLGDLFADSGALYNQSQARLGRQAGQDAFTTLMASRMKQPTTVGGSGGMVTATP